MPLFVYNCDLGSALIRAENVNVAFDKARREALRHGSVGPLSIRTAYQKDVIEVTTRGGYFPPEGSEDEDRYEKPVLGGSLSEVVREGNRLLASEASGPMAGVGSPDAAC